MHVLVGLLMQRTSCQLLLWKAGFGKLKSNDVGNCKSITRFYCQSWIEFSWEFSCVACVFQNLSARDRHWRVASSQELLVLYTSDRELFCHRLVTGDKTCVYHWATLSKLEFVQKLQWKDVYHPTFTWICKSANNWVRLWQRFFWDTDGLLMTDYLHPGKTTTGQYYTEPTFKLLDVNKRNRTKVVT